MRHSYFTMAKPLHYSKSHSSPDLPTLPLPLPLLLFSIFSLLPLSALSISSIGPQQNLTVIRYASGNFFAPLSPSQPSNPIPVGNPKILVGFPGINVYEDSRGGTLNPLLDPPDMALAVGSGYVLQAVNGAIQVFLSETRKPVTDVTAMNQFFNVAPYFQNEVFIQDERDFLSDPRAFYDPLTKRFFVFIWGTPGPKNVTRFPNDLSFQIVAVSRSSNPLNGFYYYKYNADLMDSGDLHAEAGPCPCFPDYQMVGFDYYGVQITSNSFTTETDSFVGIQFQVINKQDLVSGKNSPTAVRFDGSPKTYGFISQGEQIGTDPDLEESIYFSAYTVQPAVVPFNYFPDMQNGGTQYFLSTSRREDSENGVELWALTNTQSLRFLNPKLRITRRRIFTEAYNTSTTSAVQKNGSASFSEIQSGSVLNLDTGDCRMHQVVFGNGTLMGSFTTGVFDSSTEHDKTGIAYVAISPWVSKKTGLVQGRRIGEGRFSIPGSWAFSPSIIFNKNRAMVVFALSGPSFYPSVGVFSIRRNPYRTKRYVVVYNGTEPKEASTARTDIYGILVSRWGDYFASCLDEEGNIWIAGETTVPSIGGLANWGTYIAKISGNYI